MMGLTYDAGPQGQPLQAYLLVRVDLIQQRVLQVGIFSERQPSAVLGAGRMWALMGVGRGATYAEGKSALRTQIHNDPIHGPSLIRAMLQAYS